MHQGHDRTPHTVLFGIWATPDTDRLWVITARRFALLRRDFQEETIAKYFFWTWFIFLPGRIHPKSHGLMAFGLVLISAGEIMAYLHVVFAGELAEVIGLSLASMGAALHTRAA